MTMGISLYTTRVVLKSLGEVDYGIYNLVAGMIVMLSFLNTALATSTQRFLSFNQGVGSFTKLNKIFTNSTFLHIVIAFVVVMALELLGFFLFDGFLNIPSDRIESAKLVFHFMGLTVFFTMITVPFTGLLISHENMIWVAVVNVIEVVLKLFIAIVISFSNIDKLELYGGLMASVFVVSFFLYAFFCLRKYPESTFRHGLQIDKKILIELSGFAGWNLFGALCSIARNEGNGLILNIFYGTVINASYGIANQVNSQLLFFSRTMLRAINPQIMRNEGAGNRERVVKLSMVTCRVGFFLLSFFSIPVIFNMKEILQIWLGNVPEFTEVFCTLILLSSIINQLTIGIQSAILAKGELKFYHIFVGSILLLNLPVSYFVLFNFELPPYSILYFYLFVEIIATIIRIEIGMRLLEFNFIFYWDNVLSNVLYSTIIFGLFVAVIYCFPLSINLFVKLILMFLIYLIVIYSFGIKKDEKIYLNRFVSDMILKLRQSYASK